MALPDCDMRGIYHPGTAYECDSSVEFFLTYVVSLEKYFQLYHPDSYFLYPSKKDISW